MHASYYTLQLVVGIQVVHSETVKITSNTLEGLALVSDYQLRQVVLNELFSRSSMSADSPVRVIREKMQSLIGDTARVLFPGGDEQTYQKEQALKTTAIGYVFNEPIPAYWLYTHADVDTKKLVEQMHVVKETVDGRKVFDGAKLFELKATHGMPLDFALTRVFAMGYVVEWGSFIQEARKNKRWDFQTIAEIENALKEIQVPQADAKAIVDRLKVYVLKYPHPELV